MSTFFDQDPQAGDTNDNDNTVPRLAPQPQTTTLTPPSHHAVNLEGFGQFVGGVMTGQDCVIL
jgi:hypothetical protein